MGTLELVKSILNGEKIQNEEIEKAIDTSKCTLEMITDKNNNIVHRWKRITDEELLTYKNMFSDSIESFINNNYTQSTPVTVLKHTPKILQEKAEMKDYELQITSKIIRKILLPPDSKKSHKHNIPKAVLKDLPIQLHKPIGIYKQNDNGHIIVLTEHIIRKNPIICAIEINKTIDVKNNIKINSIRSLHDKKCQNFFAALYENRTKLYEDKKKMDTLQAFLQHGGVSSATIPSKKSISQNKIKSMPTVNKSILHDDVTINIKDVTVGNRQAKIDCLEKSFTDKLNYGKALVEYVEKDDTPVLKDLITLRIARFDKEKIDKAVRTLSFSLDTELKAPKGEAFTYKAQEDLTNLFVKELTEKTKELYTMIISYFGLPEMRILTKANLVYKGKVVYSPETGKPISEKDWAKFVDALEKFLNRNYKGIGKRIVLSADALGRILDRLTDTKKLEEIKKLRLDELKYKGKKFEWISDSVKNMTDTFGESLSRIQQAKIQVMTQSAAQRITKVTDVMRNDIQQILIDGVKNHQSKSQISQALFDKCVGLNRDFQRISDTEIHNAATEAYINEEVYKTPEEKKVYFKRFEILDGNTCKKCSSIDGMIALYSDTPLSSQKIVDDYAEIAIWEGCGILNDKEIPMSGCHPYCRGAWIRYYPETEREVKEMMQ